MADPILLFEQVNRSFGRQRSVGAVDLAVRPGEWVSLIGMPGSGKSTVVRLAAGLELPDGGSVRVFGQPPSVRPQRAGSAVGVVLGEGDLDPDETVRANLRFRARLQGMRSGAFAARLPALLAAFEMADKQRDRPRALSGLDLCRASIAAAVIHAPRLLILGQLGAGLSQPARRQLLNNLKALKEAEGFGVLWATTRFADAESADRVVIINDGIIRFDGTAAGLLETTGAATAAGAVAKLIGDTAGMPLSGAA